MKEITTSELKERIKKKNEKIKALEKKIEMLVIRLSEAQESRALWRDRFNSIKPLLPDKYYKITYHIKASFDENFIQRREGIKKGSHPDEIICNLEHNCGKYNYVELIDILEIAS